MPGEAETDDRARDIQARLSKAERELQGWMRKGFREHINAGRLLVKGLRAELEALRKAQP